MTTYLWSYGDSSLCLSELTGYGYFSLAVMSQHDQGSLQKKTSYGALQFQREREAVANKVGNMAARQAGGYVAIACILRHNHKAKRELSDTH